LSFETRPARGGICAILREHGLDVGDADDRALALRELHGRAGLVEQIDRLVGQLAVVQVAAPRAGRGLDGLVV
jgi:hypothetical protein